MKLFLCKKSKYCKKKRTVKTKAIGVTADSVCQDDHPATTGSTAVAIAAVVLRGAVAAAITLTTT